MIHEVIVTSSNIDGTIHTAPMGVRREEQDWLIAPFRPSRTLDNLERTRCAVINMTDDVTIFAGCVVGKTLWPTVAAAKIASARLAISLGHVEVNVIELRDDHERPVFRCKTVHEAQHAAFLGFNRAQAAVLEAAVMISRLHQLPHTEISKALEALSVIIEKTAGQRERIAWEWLTQKFQKHMANINSAMHP